MKTKHHLLPQHLLSQLANKYQCNPLGINLRKVLKNLFHENPPQELAIAIDRFCIAALTEGHAWQQGSPANALHLGHTIELLIEIAYLLHQKNSKVKTNHKLPDRLKLLPAFLPMPLNAAEYKQPQLFLSAFFKYQCIQKWKLLLACFTESALGTGSVAEERPRPELLQFNLYLKKLVYTVWRRVMLDSR